MLKQGKASILLLKYSECGGMKVLKHNCQERGKRVACIITRFCSFTSLIFDVLIWLHQRSLTGSAKIQVYLVMFVAELFLLLYRGRHCDIRVPWRWRLSLVLLWLLCWCLAGCRIGWCIGSCAKLHAKYLKHFYIEQGYPLQFFHLWNHALRHWKTMSVACFLQDFGISIPFLHFKYMKGNI